MSDTIFRGHLSRRLTFKDVNWDVLYPDGTDARIKFNYARRTHDDLKDLNKLLRLAGGKRRRQSVAPPSSFFKKSSASERRQLCMVKFNYGGGRGGRSAHLEFINRYMRQLRKDDVAVKPELFGNISHEEYKKRAAGRHYKWILSPETAMDAEALKAFAKSFVARMERQTGRRYDWQAAAHTDTPHPHVHIVVNGVDADGNPFRFAPSFVRTVAREDAQDILTDALGGRTEEQIEAARDRRIAADRWTEYDEAIQERLVPDAADEYAGYFPDFVTDATLRRLEHLRDMRLADWRDGRFFLKKGWDESLRNVGRYNMYLDAQRHVSPLADFRLYTPDAGAVSGRVRRVYRMNGEDVWTNAVVIEDEGGGRAFYVPLYFAAPKNIRDGMEINVNCRYNQKGRLVVDIGEAKKSGGGTRKNRGAGLSQGQEH